MSAWRKQFYRILSRESILKASQRIRLGGRAVVLMYHEVAEDWQGIKAWTVVKKSHFYEQMVYLNENFRILGIPELFDLMQSGSMGTGRYAAVTFDDGYAGNKAVVVPIVESLGIPITIFVSTQAVQTQERYWYDRIILSLQRADLEFEITLEEFGQHRHLFQQGQTGEDRWERIQDLLEDLKRLPVEWRNRAVDLILSQRKFDDEGTPPGLLPLTSAEVGELGQSGLVTLGAHSHCHNILTQLDDDDLRRTVRLSKSLIESWSGKKIKYFAYPNGNYNEKVKRVLQEEGFAGGLTTMPGRWKSADSPFEVRRIGIGRYDTIERFKAVVSGLIP
jgi:peptidoglycan/xylan/chitin deacetylase (PgdA/CDA1 family)